MRLADMTFDDFCFAHDTVAMIHLLVYDNRMRC